MATYARVSNLKKVINNGGMGHNNGGIVQQNQQITSQSQGNITNHRINRLSQQHFKEKSAKISLYREFSPYANFITANFITAVFQNYY
jgi:hypothetical protein